MPLQILFEEIYYFAFHITKSTGVAIIVFSFIVSLLLLPIYRRADKIQQDERSLEDKMSKGVEHIKKIFRGDEQLLMLQTYYRKNNYSPVYALRGSLSLILQIPFFIAAYQFLSNLEILKGTSCGFIRDLSVPDALINIAGLSINVLPILMTLVNIISTYIFTQGLSMKTKIQLNTMTLFFLVFLYNAPAGLVLYWTCNNVFNLAKSVIGKLENPKNGVYIILSVSSLIVAAYGFYNALELSSKVVGRILLYVLLLNMPFIISKTNWKVNRLIVATRSPNIKLFLASTIFLTILIGGVIPSAVISSSPQEFVVNNYLTNPSIYLSYALTIAFGTFVIWLGVFYWLATPRTNFCLRK